MIVVKPFLILIFRSNFAERIGEEVREVHVVEQSVRVLARVPNFDGVLDDSAQAGRPVPRDFDAIDIVTSHRAHERSQARVRRHRIDRVAVREHDPRVGVGGEQMLEAPHVCTGLQHPPLTHVS